MKKLIKLSDYVIQSDLKKFMEVQSINHQNSERANRYYNILKYAKLLQQKPTLGMFIPCDLDGNVLEEPLQGLHGNEQYEGALMDEYQQAKERVLFKGFKLEIENNELCFIENEEMQLNFVYLKDRKLLRCDFTSYRTIEDLTSYGLELNKEI